MPIGIVHQNLTVVPATEIPAFKIECTYLGHTEFEAFGYGLPRLQGLLVPVEGRRRWAEFLPLPIIDDVSLTIPDSKVKILAAGCGYLYRLFSVVAHGQGGFGGFAYPVVRCGNLDG
ncbi:hypothetical protein ES703_111413 [subsurface metagenome]